jgi:hypothetical protein
MPWIPDDVPPRLLGAVSAQQWMNWADGASTGTAPHEQPTSVYACRINKNVNSPDGITYRAGMQGQVLGMNQDKTSYKVFIEGVTEGDGFANRFVPKQYVDLGPPWKTDLEDWKLNIHLPATIVASQRWASSTAPDTTVLGRTVHRLITAFRDSPLEMAPAGLAEYLQKLNVTVITRTILAGIKAAGAYNVLNHSNGFSAADLHNVAQKITSATSSNESGVYARFHVSSKTVAHWKSESSYAYVGKTNDFGSRFTSHKATKSAYGDLTRNSSSLKMIVLCKLSNAESSGSFFLVEQIFVCLLQTYREILLLNNTAIKDTDMLGHFQAARYFADVSQEVFRQTGWPGGVISRPAAFGIQYGANCSSPLLEFGSTYESSLFIRTDANIKDGSTGSIVPMAFYRRADHKVATRSKWSKNPGRGQHHDTAFVRVYAKHLYEPPRTMVTFGYSLTKTTDPREWPLAGTPYQLVFEVRKDGTAHPEAWARLCEIGRFENWNQANSLRVRIEWQHPQDSGKWLFRYLQAKVSITTQVDEKVPGSLTTYTKAISTIQWLTGNSPNHRYPWIPRLWGSARVLFADYDYMTQSITLKPPPNDIPMLSGRARPDDALIFDMRKAEYNLAYVNGTFGQFGAGPATNRKKCDLCLMVGDGITGGKVLDKSCVRYKDSSVCTNCRSIGHACCSWTRGLQSDPNPASQEKDYLRTEKVRAALFRLPLAGVPSGQGFSQSLRALTSSEDSGINDDSDDHLVDSTDLQQDNDSDID